MILFSCILYLRNQKDIENSTDVMQENKVFELFYCIGFVVIEKSISSQAFDNIIKNITDFSASDDLWNFLNGTKYREFYVDVTGVQ